MTKEVKKFVEEGFKFFVKDGSCDKIIKPYKVLHYAKTYAEKHGYIVEDKNGNKLFIPPVAGEEEKEITIPESFSEKENAAAEQSIEEESVVEETETSGVSFNPNEPSLKDLAYKKLKEKLEDAGYYNIGGGYLTTKICGRITTIISALKVDEYMNDCIKQTPEEKITAEYIASETLAYINTAKEEKREKAAEKYDSEKKDEEPVKTIAVADVTPEVKKKNWFQKLIDKIFG